MTPENFYKSRVNKLDDELAKIKNKLGLSSTVRLVLFLITVIGVYLNWNNIGLISLMIGVIGSIFIFLLLQHNKLKHQKNLLLALLERNKKEIRVLNRDFFDLPNGLEYADPTHAYSQDIDLFGKGSFYQYLNRTSLKAGSDALANFLLSNETDRIVEKQEAVKELAAMPEWLHQFGAVASLVKTEVSVQSLNKWLKDYRAFLPQKIKLISIVFSGMSILSWTLYFLDLLSGYAVFAIFLLGLGITGRYLKEIGKLSAHTTQAQSTFRQYASLISALEGKNFTSKLLNGQKAIIVGESTASSKILKKFSKLLDALDQRNNILISVVANGFLLRDLFVCKNIEEWIENYRERVPEWFATIAFFDGYNSLGNYAFNHTAHTFPDIIKSDQTMICKGAVHPLLHPEKAIANDFEIAKDEFFVITGANMAGKSTFLRTVGLQIVMANIGLPISAKEVGYSPIKLITSMRTTDSLTDDESYFFSELKRLKMIVETIQKEPYFIILDEILKGTNSADKATGSKKFIEKLVNLKTSGIIATHDLSLCTIADGLKEVKNHYFDAQIVEGELFFDYKFKKGICQNMNASFLLQKMGIVE